MKLHLMITALLIWLWLPGVAQEVYTASKDTLLMGSVFSFTAVHKTEQGAWNAINHGIAEVVRIESVISSWLPDSETARINDNAGIQPVKVSRELFNLIFRAKKVSELSNGYFDISYASMDKVWNFNNNEVNIPHEEAILASIAKINYKDIALNAEAQTVYLKKKGMKIGFGAIGKGYAANRAKQVMQDHGANAGVVNAGGDLLSWGNNMDGQPWSIGIADPNDENKMLVWLNISDMAVVTSGDYERYVTIKGKRYGHIINPKTGWPVQGLKSATIICRDAELADALATTVFVLGEKEGLELINTLEGVEGILINDKDEMIYSDQVELNFLQKD